MKTLEVLFTPSDFEALKGRDLSSTLCVVFDVLRATSTMITALANGAVEIIPVSDIPEAVGIRQRRAEVLLAGEREGVRIEASLTGSIAFDLGNSPREFIPSKVGGRSIVMTTTNGTRAFRACARAATVLACSLLNLSATARWITKQAPAHVMLVCSGTYEEAAYEDILAAGACCDRLLQAASGAAMTDGALAARQLYRIEQGDLLAALSRSRNGRRLLSRPELAEDVAFCAQLDVLELVATQDREGAVRQI